MITRHAVKNRVTKKEYYAYLIEDTNECKDFFKAQFNLVVIPIMIGTHVIANPNGEGMYHFCTEEELHENYMIMGIDYLSVINICDPNRETNSTVAGVRAGKTLNANTDDDRLMTFIKERLQIRSPSADMHDWAYGPKNSLGIDASDDRSMERVAEKLRDIYGVKTDSVAQACSESDPIQKITVDDVVKLRKELFKEKLDNAVQILHPNICRSPSMDMHNWAYGWPTFCHLDIRNMAKEKAKEKTDMKNTITLDIKKVIFNDPATIVIWADGTKTVVKCREGETYSKWAGLAFCYAKRINGNKFHAEFKRWCGEDEEQTEETRYSSGSAYSVADSFAEIGKNARTCLETIARAFNGDDGTDPEPGSIQPTVAADSMKDSDFMFKVKDVKFNTYAEACDIRHDMHECVAKYGYVTVLDYYDLTITKYDKKEAEIAQHYGWDDSLCGPEIKWNGEGKCYLNLPSPKNLDFKKAIDEIKRTK